MNGDFGLAVVDFTGKPTDTKLVGFCNERMVLVLTQSPWMDLAATGDAANNRADAVRTVPGKHTVAAGDLSSLEHCPSLLGSPRGIGRRIADLLFRRVGFELEVTARSDSVLTLLGLCHYSMGACLRPERFLPVLFDGKQLRTLCVPGCGPDTTYAIQFGVPATSCRWSVIGDFIHCAREVTIGASQ